LLRISLRERPWTRRSNGSTSFERSRNLRQAGWVSFTHASSASKRALNAAAA
jgi:hypothetical protein